MPRPKPGETKDEYIPRCISYVMSNEGITDPKQAAGKCHGLWKQYKDGTFMYLIDEIDNYVTVKPGDPLRLFKFGKIIKKGIEHIITPELAAKFKIPHFKPPIKLGGHEDELPAGGHLVGLEVREDGLYGRPEYNEKGSQALAEGAWRYTSPEVIWDEDGGFENPETGETINGPLIVGLALLHRPHLGEDAALYHVEPIKKEREIMTEEVVSVPKSFFEGILSVFKREPEGDPEPIIPDEYKAAMQERDTLKAEKAEAEKLAAQVARHEELKAEFVGDKIKEEFGAAFVKLGDEKETLEMLAGMSKEQAEWVIRNFKALSAQVKEGELTGEKGSTEGGEESPTAVFDAAIHAVMAEKKVDYLTAMDIVRKEKPDLAKSYQATI